MDSCLNSKSAYILKEDMRIYLVDITTMMS